MATPQPAAYALTPPRITECGAGDERTFSCAVGLVARAPDGSEATVDVGRGLGPTRTLAHEAAVRGLMDRHKLVNAPRALPHPEVSPPHQGGRPPRSPPRFAPAPPPPSPPPLPPPVEAPYLTAADHESGRTGVIRLPAPPAGVDPALFAAAAYGVHVAALEDLPLGDLVLHLGPGGAGALGPETEAALQGLVAYLADLRQRAGCPTGCSSG